MRTGITLTLILSIAITTMSFTIGSKSRGIVTFSGQIIGMNGERVENVRIKVFVDREYRSYRFIEDGNFNFTLPEQSHVQLYFCHATMAEVYVGIDTRIDPEMKGAKVDYDILMHNKSLSDQLEGVYDFKNNAIADFKINDRGVGINRIEEQTAAFIKEVSCLSK